MSILPKVSQSLMTNQRTFSTSITVPATNLIMEEFHVSRTQSLLPLTLYTLGLAFGPLVLAPLSEAFGRKWVYVASSTFHLAFIGGGSAASNFATLLACRLIAGTLGSAAIAIGAGSIADIWQLEKAGAGASLLFILAPFLGPTLGPLAGAYILDDRGYDWRWTQYLLLIIGAPLWLGCLLMKETSKTRIQQSQKPGAKFDTKALGGILRRALVRPTVMLLTEPVVYSLAIYAAYAYAMIFSYFASASYVLQTLYSFNLREVGLSFISVIIGYLLGVLVYLVCDITLHKRARSTSRNGLADPEHRLYASFIGGIFLPAGLFW